MDEAALLENIAKIAKQFAGQRRERQQRRTLDPHDFAALHEAGFTLTGAPAEVGGLWKNVADSVRPICTALRILARGDSSVALVSAMHPAVLSYWLTAPAEAAREKYWGAQCDEIFQGVRQGTWWGTITSEPGSGGDIARTRAVAEPGKTPLQYYLTGQKHFGSGSGVMSYMVTTALPSGEDAPDWFFVDVKDAPWDGSTGLKLTAEWDGHGMIATQSHAFAFERFPAARMAWSGRLAEVAKRAGPFIGCLFTSVIVGIVDAAISAAGEKLDRSDLRPYEQVEWARAKMEAWLIRQAYEGMLRAVEQQPDPRLDVLQGKTAIAELSESVLTRLCKTIGGGTFSQRSPFGFWFEDVRALGFLRPPWSLAFQTLIDGLGN